MRGRGSKAVYVRQTRVGKGIFSRRRYQPFAIIGEITGDVIEDLDYGSEYCFEIGNGLVLEPHAPFRFVNHSCEPNCMFRVFDQARAAPRQVLLIAREEIRPDRELTIDYNWLAGAAIPCKCQSPSCRGWIVASGE